VAPATATPTPAPADEPSPEAAPAADAVPEDAEAPETPPADTGASPQQADPDSPLADLGGGSLLSTRRDAGPAPRVTLAHDTLSGHISVGAAASLFVPFGSFQEDLPQSTLLDPGLGLRLDVAYGVSRTVMLGLYGELALPDGSSTWAGEKAQSIAVGPFVRYHLVQGVPFDPWIGFGAGFRRTSSGDQAYTGVDVARVQIGGDYYGFSNVGFGPLVELAVGTYVAADGTSMGAGSIYGNFTVGGRLTFDGPGK
jgi:hypothetical protein